jgi:hypothetical protein
MIKGSSIQIIGTVYRDLAQTEVANLTGASITFVIKNDPRDTDAQALVTKTIGAGVTIVDAVNGSYSVDLTAANTNGLSYSKLSYETVVKLSDNTYIRTGVKTIELGDNVLKNLP